MKIYIGEIWHSTGKPAISSVQQFETIKDGALLVDDDGKIKSAGNSSEIKQKNQGAEIIDFGKKLILPGFVDTHLHSAQLDIIGCWGKQLMDWLNKYTFPQESRFGDKKICEDTSTRFFDETLANGTTTSVVFTTSHKTAAETLFEKARDRGVRAIIGKVSMDQNSTDSLLCSVDDDIRESEELINAWHGSEGGRLMYALTPRFVPTCSTPLLKALGELHQKYPDTYVQTHHAESKEEIAFVKTLFPDDTYAGVYEKFGLLTEKTILAHTVHPKDEEISLIKDSGCAIAHCPTSNLFLGSGLFPMDQLQDLKVSLGTDIGGGTSLSMWQTMNEAYKIQQLRGTSISPSYLFYLATLGGAKALGLDDKIGSFESGKQADFQVLDPGNSRLLSKRFENGRSPAEKLFSMVILGDDRLTDRVFVAGKEVFSK